MLPAVIIMGLLQSVFCSMIFCIERVLTWACCAFVLMLLMFSILLLMVYGVAVGYHYAQKELAAFAIVSRSTTENPLLRSATNDESRSVVRLVAVNRSEVEHAPQPLLEIYQTNKPGEKLYLETSETPIFVLQTERPPNLPEPSQHEKNLARRLIGRFRRSKNNTMTDVPFLRPLRSSSEKPLTENVKNIPIAPLPQRLQLAR